MTSRSRVTSLPPIVFWSWPALPCVLGVLLFARPLVYELSEVWRVRSWIEVPAHILQVDHEQGPHALSWVTARYTYSYDGKVYTGTATLSSVITGGQQREALRRLREHRRSGQGYPCFVDPAQPSETVLKWDLNGRWIREDFFFVVIFGGMGASLVGIGLRAQLRQERQGDREQKAESR